MMRQLIEENVEIDVWVVSCEALGFTTDPFSNFLDRSKALEYKAHMAVIFACENDCKFEVSSKKQNRNEFEKWRMEIEGNTCKAVISLL